MRIGVLGTGVVGRTIAGKLTELGHDVRVGSRTAGEDKVTFADAAAHGEVVFHCASGAAALDVLAAAGEDNLAGKLVIDTSNSLDFSGGGPALFTDSRDSLGERIQKAFPSARVVKSLNTINASVMVEPSLVEGDHVVFVCGDDAGAKDQARTLLGEFGWPADRVVDLGDITGARSAEQYVLLWVRLMNATGSATFNIAVNRSASASNTQ
jgi:8-hydroxy-5-deazaflavin:NADPH oxidoreductase